MKSLSNKNLFPLIYTFTFLIFQANIISQSVFFNRLTTDDGLSNNYVYEVLQDQAGFLWFATDDGLNKYDGYDFIVYRNNLSDKNSISDNSIWTIKEDELGKIWIGTKNGFINCYDPINDKFLRWKISSNITKENPITTIFIDKNNLIWIGTYRSGLYKLDPKSGKINHWDYKADDPKSISNNYVSSIYGDSNGNIWVGTFNGLNKFNPQKSGNNFARYFADVNNQNSLSGNLIWGITPSALDKNKLWVGTANGVTTLNIKEEKFSQILIPNPDNLKFGTGAGTILEEAAGNEVVLWINSYAGLLRYNLTRNKFDRFLSDKKNVNSLISNQINNIFRDRSGVLWIATDNGLCYFSQKNMKFNNSFFYPDNYFETDELKNLNVKAITKTPENNLWIGTEKGLYRSITSGRKIKIIKHPKLISENIWTLSAGNSSDVWIGTYGAGLYNLNYKSDRLKKYDILKDRIKSSSKDFVKSILIDNKNRLWIGYWGVGLARLDLSTGKIENWLHKTIDKNSLGHDDVWVIYQDIKSRIWIGTNGGGLDLFDESSGNRFYHIIADAQKQNSLSSNSIYSIAEQKNNVQNISEHILWVGTNNGLNKIIIDDSKSDNSNFPIIKNISRFTIEDGLADNSIKSIVEDEDGNLWLGTSSGISFFNVQKKSFINFISDDGIIGNDFNHCAALKYDNNLIFMGSTSGLNYFNAAAISQSSYAPPVVITDFQIFNNPVRIGSSSVLTKNIAYTKEIVLSHTQNVFSFQFSAFDYNSTNTINYAYMMEGFDDDWINGGTRRFVTYTNLKPGNYVFKVKATNSDGIWSDKVASVKLIVTPPWWQTKWAIVLYLVVFVLGVWGIFKFQSNRVRLQNELQMREFESYHLRQIEQMKSRFFANISHEFRTPLMLIKGPLEELLRGRIKDNLTDYYKMLLRNTEKLQQLIDQLLELSQLESETIPVQKETYDIVNLLKSISNSFIPLANQKNIRFNFYSGVESAFAILDKDKFEKIINNLLNNAFKFTDTGGTVNIELAEKTMSGSRIAFVTISDTGVGISKENQSKIFTRFFQVDDSSKRNYGGSGIGLALVKELTTLLGWEVSVSSNEGEGTEFTLQIPLLSQEEIKEIISSSNVVDNQERLNGQIEFEKSDDDYVLENNSKPLILFVEDQSEVREYVIGLLKEDYNVLQAENGKAGFDTALKSLPDLIISDVMMPVMDGFELCKKLKTDWNTSHIPVILLTAKVTHQSKLEGLETGADDYLTKPFDFEELSIKIKNLITQRKQLKEKFSKNINANVESITTNLFDKEFIEKINKIIESQLQNENFTSEDLAEKLFVSRGQLNRKLNAIVGQGPGEFIRIYKLKRAAQMILENKLSITQIALEVGFSSPAQFTRAFQKHFNCLPSEFNHRLSDT